MNVDLFDSEYKWDMRHLGIYMMLKLARILFWKR